MRDNTCIYPGCGRNLRRANITNFCKEHGAHSAGRVEGFCTCPRCKSIAINYKRELPPNVRQVTVATETGYSTSGGKPAVVSLPKEPWHV